MNLLRLEVYLSKNEVMAISEGLKKIEVGGLTVIKKRGRGRSPPPELHAGKGSMTFTPQFSSKYVIELVVDEKQKEKAVKIIRENATKGKIFVSPISETVDIASGDIDADYK